MNFTLEFVGKQKVAADAWRLDFAKPNDYNYKAGQYLELHLQHPHGDDRGDVRWFTVSSSPTEDHISITTRHVKDHPSSFKNALFGLEKGDTVPAKGPMGEFVLPDSKATKLVWVAGGIGVTPFIAQLRYLLDTKDLDRDIILIYGNRSDADIVCSQLLEESKRKMPNFQLIRVYSEQPPSFIDEHVETGLIDEKLLSKYISDPHDREYYVSGPEPMVDSFEQILKFLGIRENHIHQDWFPGYTEKY